VSKRNGRNKIRLEYLSQINTIDKRLKKKKIRENEDENSKLLSKRKSIQQKLKTQK